MATMNNWWLLGLYASVSSVVALLSRTTKPSLKQPLIFQGLVGTNDQLVVVWVGRFKVDSCDSRQESHKTLIFLSNVSGRWEGLTSAGME